MNAPLRFCLERAPGQLCLGQGDIVSFCAPAPGREAVQAVVNAANGALAGGSGVDGAIHAAAGPELPRACREIIARRGPLSAGEAEITPGFSTGFSHIIHAVGPIWRGGHGGEPEALARAYRRCLELCREHSIDSVAFPALSCGAYGYPVDLAAPIALAELARGLREGLARRAWMVLYSPSAYETWLGHARRILQD